jgi:hypothetical protein
MPDAIMTAAAPAPDFTGVPFTDRGPAMQTFSGRPFYLLDPRPDEVCLFDIAAHLAKINRFSGATRAPYSVAQHCVLVSQVVPPSMALMGLLHDAGEAYTNDISRPMKRALERIAPGIVAEVCGDIDRAIWLRFGIAPETVAAAHDAIKLADNIACSTERRDLLCDPVGFSWGEMPKPLAARIEPWSAAKAEAMFLWRFRQLAPQQFALADQERRDAGRRGDAA